MNLKSSLFALLLLSTGLAWAGPDKLDQDQLTRAIMDGADAKQVADMLRRGAHAGKADQRGQTPLMTAAYWSKPEVIRLLLDRGADVNAKGREGATPLMAATRAQEAASIKLLLNRGAEVNAKQSDGNSALSLAIGLHAPKPVVRLLLEHGADANTKEIEGQPAFIEAAYAADLDIVELMLDHGADVNIAGFNGRTALMFVTNYRQPAERARFLIDHGANVNAQDPAGITALMIAADRNTPEILQLLLDQGAKVNARDVVGKTALQYATERRNGEAAAILQQHGALVYAVDTRKQEALRSAAEQAQREKTDNWRKRLAAEAAAKPRPDTITEAMVQEFLQNLHKVIEHGDLGDLAFIEQTLGVQAVWQTDGGPGPGGKSTSYALTRPQSRVLQDKVGFVTLRRTPAGGKWVVDIDLAVSDYRPHQPDAALAHMQRLFGKAQYEHMAIPEFANAPVPNITTYSYRWQRHNDIALTFTFQGTLGRVDLSQNNDARTQHVPLKPDNLPAP